MNWRQISLKTGGLCSLAAALATQAAIADPTGVYVRSLMGEASHVERCFDAVQQPGAADMRGIGSCTELVESDPPRNQVRIAGLTNRAILYRRAGQLDRAQQDCARALADPDAGAATATSCAAVYLSSSKPGLALKVLSESEAPPSENRAQFFHNLALAHHDLGQYELAYEAIEHALAAEPDFAPTIELKALYRVEAAN